MMATRTNRSVSEEMLEREAGHAVADPARQVRGYRDIAGHGDPRRPAADAERYRRIECPVWILRGSEELKKQVRALQRRLAALTRPRSAPGIK